jgi:hypothetical protein
VGDIFQFLWPSYNIWTSQIGSQCPNVSTTPLQQWGFWQCLPFSWTTLRGKNCRHPIDVMGVIDTFEQYHFEVAFEFLRLQVFTRFSNFAFFPRLKVICIMKPQKSNLICFSNRNSWINVRRIPIEKAGYLKIRMRLKNNFDNVFFTWASSVQCNEGRCSSRNNVIRMV